MLQAINEAASYIRGKIKDTPDTATITVNVNDQIEPVELSDIEMNSDARVIF